MNNWFQLVRSFLKLRFGIGISRSYSQDAEDVLAAIYLRAKAGVYVDVGAYHPIQYSNTYHFYKKGWSGVVVDPNPALRDLYRVFRARDIFVCSGVGSVAQKCDYHLFTDGAYNTFSKERANELDSKNYPQLITIEKREIRPLRDILEENGTKKIDFLSIDVEGLEIDVLNSHNWDIRPKVIAVEDNDFDYENIGKSQLYLYLSQKNYKLVAGSPRTPIFLDSAVVV